MSSVLGRKFSLL